MTSARSPHAISLAIHIGFATLLFTTAVRVSHTPPAVKRAPLFINLSDYRGVLLRPARPRGGGGGAREPLPAGSGQLPKAAPRQFAPPMILHEASQPELLVEPSLAIAADAPLVNVAQWGDPMSNFRGRSNGPGDGGGMGSGSNGGVGTGDGPGFGPGDTPGAGGFRSSTYAGLVAPRILYKVEPEFSDQARRAKHHGVVRLAVDIDPSGRPGNIRVIGPLGLGLDEKAVEAVSRWRFRAGTRDGKPVTMRAVVEVNFHLL